MKLSTAVDQFLTDGRINLRPSTLAAYRSDLNLLVSLASVRFADNVIAFTADLVRDYLRTLAGKGLAAATLHRRRASVSELAKWCLLRRLVAEHPMAETEKMRRPRTLPRPFAHDDADRLESLALTGVEAVIRLLLFHAGLRVQELCDIRVRDVDFGVDEQDGAIRVHGKGGKERVVPLTPDLWHRLRDYMLSSVAVDHLNAFLLARSDGRPWTRRMIERRTRAWGRSVRLDKVTPHRFRHTFATRLLEGNAAGDKADLRQVQELLGHADISTTAAYTAVTTERLRSAVNLLSTRRKLLALPPD